MKKMILRAAMLLGFMGTANYGHCAYGVGGTFSNIQQQGPFISFECDFSGECIRSRGSSSLEPKPGDVVEVNIAGTWYCCLTLENVPENAQNPDPEQPSQFGGTIDEGTPLFDLLPAN